MSKRIYLFGLLTSLALGSTGVRADDAEKPAAKPNTSAESAAEAPLDEELLEFLGSVDSGDEDWMDYLAATDIAKVAKAAPPRAASEVKKDE